MSCCCPSYALAGASWTCWRILLVLCVLWERKKKSEQNRLSDTHVSNDTSGAWTDKGMGTSLTQKHCSPHPVQQAASVWGTKDQHRGAGGPFSGLTYVVCLNPAALSIWPVHIVPVVLMLLIAMGSYKRWGWQGAEPTAP